MAEHFHRELSILKQQIHRMGGLVEENLQRATTSVIEHNPTLAQAVLESDEEINRLEVEVEEACLKILALYQPVAVDLRYVIAVLKMNNELERIGDYAVNISKRALSFNEEPEFVIPSLFADMANSTRAMLSNSLDALINFSEASAREVVAADDAVDELNGEIYDYVRFELEGGNTGQASSLIHLLTVSRMVERTADRVTNIAEDIIYMIEGTIIRHSGDD